MKINWNNYINWVNNLPKSSKVIACENKDKVIDLSDITGKQHRA